MGSLPFTVSQRRLAAIALVAVVAIVLLLKHAHHGGATAPSLAVAPLSGTTAVNAAAARARSPGLVVDVVGAVKRPGVYTVPSGDRIVDAIARAGGFTAHADRSAVNLAAPLVDGEQVVVAGGGAGTGAGGAAGSSAPGAPVSLNSATAEQLDSLPGIGPVTAQKIIDYRTQHGPFTSVDGLDAIPGIGAARIAELQGLVVP